MLQLDDALGSAIGAEPVLRVRRNGVKFRVRGLGQNAEVVASPFTGDGNHIFCGIAVQNELVRHSSRSVALISRVGTAKRMRIRVCFFVDVNFY